MHALILVQLWYFQSITIRDFDESFVAQQFWLPLTSRVLRRVLYTQQVGPNQSPAVGTQRLWWRFLTRSRYDSYTLCFLYMLWNPSHKVNSKMNKNNVDYI